MTTATTLIGDRRRQALERAAAARRHPAQRHSTVGAKVATPPPAAFYLITVVIAVFVMLGLVMVMSASTISEFRRGNSPWRIFNRQLMWAGLGCVGLWIGLRTPYYIWRKLVLPVLMVAYGLMLAPFMPGIGLRVNGARAWVAIGSFSFQPSEFLKLAILLYCAHFLSSRHDRLGDLRASFTPVLVVAGIGAGLSLVQSDLGSAIVIASIVFVVAFLAGVPSVPLGAAGLAGAAGAVAFVMSTPFRRQRFTAFWDITANKDHLSYQTYQAMIAMAQGGIVGEGVGRGSNKLGGFLPLAHSDFIFAVIAEELGLIGVVGVIGGFLLLAYAGIQVALAAADRFATLVAGGIVGWFVVQAVINVGGVTGMMPVTGLTLPFFSAGGSSLFVCMTASGILMNIARSVR
jgi:cell division protein FtsW